jgi:two-component system OmpR family response regulator
MARTDKKVRIFSALEIANICGVVNQTAINWIKNGYLKAFTTPGGQYRVYSEDLVDFLHSRGMRMPDELQRILEQQLSIGTVLIVDDDVELNNNLKQALEVMNPDYTIHQAFDGFEAGKISVEYKPQLVILDIDLPGVDGYKLCKEFKDGEGLTPPIIIAVSGMDDPAVEGRILTEGADAFIAKPIDFKEIEKVIDEISGGR